MDKNVPVKEKNTIDKKIFIGLFIFIVLIIVLLLTFVANIATPKKVFDSSLDKIFKNLNKTNDDIKTINGDFNLKFNINSKEEQEVFDIINELSLKLNYGIDYEKSLMNIDIDTTFKDKDLINANFYSKDETGYVYLKNIFDKYIEIPMEGFSEVFDSKDLINDYQTVVKELEKALKKSLKDKYFKSEKATLKIKDKETKVTKNIFNLTKENQKSFYKDLVNNLNNDNFITSIANITNQDKDDIKKSLEDINNEEIDADEDFTISIYTKGMHKEFVGFEFEVDETAFTVIKESKGIYNYNIEDVKGTIKINEKDNKYTGELSINYEGNEIIIYFETGYKYNEKIEEKDINNKVYYEDLTEEDQKTIQDNFMKLDGINDLINSFSSLVEPQNKVYY